MRRLLIPLCLVFGLAGCSSISQTDGSPSTVPTTPIATSPGTPTTAHPVVHHPRRRPRPKPHPAPSASGLAYSTASAHHVQPQPTPGSCHATGRSPYELPDRHCTPGALNPAVTQATIDHTICVQAYTKTIRPEVFSEALGGVPYRLALNKWYVDELYDAAFVQLYLAVTQFTAWFDANVIDGVVNGSAALVRLIARVTGLFDNVVVDGAVNGVADAAQFTGRRFRNFQTGAISWYVYVILLGVIGSVLLYRSLAVAS